MKKHVKLISSALVLSLVFALCSCDAGKKETETEAPTTTTTEATTVETTTETTEEPTTTTTLPPLQNYDLTETLKVMTDCVGKDPESSKKAFEDFFGCTIDDIEPSEAYDKHLIYYYEIRLEIDGVECKYLVFDMNTDGKTINQVSFQSDLSEKKDILDAFERFCKKSEELYGKPYEEFLGDSTNVVNYGVSKKVGFSIADYFLDTSNGFSFGTFSR